MSKTNAEWVTLYETAIEAILVAGQSYEIAGRKFTRADLRELQENLAHYQRLVSRPRGMRRNAVQFGGR